MSRLALYLNTAKYLKPSQVYYRCMRKMHRSICLQYHYKPVLDENLQLGSLEPLKIIDYDKAFLSRYDVDAICDDTVTFLHVSKKADWKTIWNDANETDLWRFNLHYFEFLIPLAKAFESTGEGKYLEKAVTIISAWIDSNPQSSGGVGWASYTISLRLINWLEWFELTNCAAESYPFYDAFVKSIREQYCFLATHLEKDVLANHYLEDLKTLAIVSLVLGDGQTHQLAMGELTLQLDEQILADGMHFELSPMYHKIVLEDLLRVASALKCYGKNPAKIADKLQKMVDCLNFLEGDLNRTLLFNDSGDNVAKSADSLLAQAKDLLGIVPRKTGELPNAGYYLLERRVNSHAIKVIIDAGKPAPEYAAGHAHCDMLSYECYVDGNPLITNAGTYEYALGDNRRYYRSTAAHNTAMCGVHEQSECWAQFRMARRAKVSNIEADMDNYSVKATCTNYLGESITRSISLDEGGHIQMSDSGANRMVKSFVHSASSSLAIEATDGTLSKGIYWYAPEYGLKVERPVYTIVASGMGAAYSIDTIGSKQGGAK